MNGGLDEVRSRALERENLLEHWRAAAKANARQLKVATRLFHEARKKANALEAEMAALRKRVAGSAPTESDLVSRLLARGRHLLDYGSPGAGDATEFFADPLCREAAGALERQRAQIVDLNARLGATKTSLLEAYLLARDIQELNTGNYNHDEVANLNDGLIALFEFLKSAVDDCNAGAEMKSSNDGGR